MSLVNYRMTQYREVLQVGAGEEIQLKIAALADFDQAVDQLFQVLQARGEAERLHELCPFFGNLWPAARGLARYLARRGRTSLAGCSVLEVGCGLAFPSILAARLGADVTATDGHPEVPLFLERNLTLNAIEGVKYVAADWRSDEVALGRFELVIGSDVLYERTHPALLARLIERQLTEKGEAVIADPGRAYLQDFERCMTARGFTSRLETQDEIFVLSLSR